MPLAFVLIEVAPAPQSAEYEAAMITACNEAVRQGSCLPAGDSSARGSPAALAIVSWQGANNQAVHIQVGLPRGPKASWLSREMQFQPADAPIERWRAVGFAIGTLAEEQEARRSEEEKLQPPVAPVPSAAPPLPPARTPRRAQAPQRLDRRWLGVGALAGPALDQGSWRGGVWGSGSHRLGDTPWFARVSSSYSEARPGAGLSMGWFTFAAGVGLSHAATRKLALRASLEWGWQLVRASVQDEAGRTDRAGRWSAGPRAGLHSAWRLGDGVALGAGLEGWKLSSPTEVRLRGERIGSSPDLGFAAMVGLEFFLP